MPDKPSPEQGVPSTVEQDGISLTRRAGVPVLANFRLLQKLGEGGMGYVYKAEDVVIQKPVALKILHKHYAEKPEFLARFHQEARAAGKLNHPNIVSAVSTGEANGHFYYVMEYCEGEPLDKWLTREKVMPWEQALEIASQVALGLEHAHEHGIVHRDIKPANVMLTPEGKAKILDFGLAKNVMSLDDVTTEQRGVAWGTPNYISPEQGRNDKAIGPAADIYSLGAMLFHLVTGQTPFKGTGRELIKKHLTQKIPDPRSIKPDLPPAMTCLLVNMMAKASAQRYADCGQLRAAIKLTREGHLPTFPAVYEEKARAARSPANSPTEKVAPIGDPLQLIPPAPSKAAPPVPGPVVALESWEDTRKPLRRSPWAWVALPLFLALVGGLSYWALARREAQVAASPAAKAELDPAAKKALEEADRLKLTATEASTQAAKAKAEAENLKRQLDTLKKNEEERHKAAAEQATAERAAAERAAAEKAVAEKAVADNAAAEKAAADKAAADRAAEKEAARQKKEQEAEEARKRRESPAGKAAEALREATEALAQAKERFETAQADYKRAEDARSAKSRELETLKGRVAALSGQYEAAQFERDGVRLSQLRRMADDLNRQIAAATRDLEVAKGEADRARVAWIKAQQEYKAAQEKEDLARKAVAAVKPGEGADPPASGGETGSSAAATAASLRSRFMNELRGLAAKTELAKAEPELRTSAAKPEFASAKEDLEAFLKDYALGAAFEQDGLKALAASNAEMALPEELAQKWKTPTVKVTGYEPGRGLQVNAGGASFSVPAVNAPPGLVADAAKKAGREFAAALYFLLRGQRWETQALLPKLADAQRFRLESWLALAQDTSAESGTAAGGGSTAKVAPPPAPPKEFSQFKLSKGRYGEKDDLDAAIVREFGSGYRLADWNDVLPYKDRIAALADAVGLVENQDVLISRNGRGMLGTRRHYILARHNHSRPPGWSVFETIDGNLVDLGSGSALNAPMLVIREEAGRPLPGTADGDRRGEAKRKEEGGAKAIPEMFYTCEGPGLIPVVQGVQRTLGSPYAITIHTPDGPLAVKVPIVAAEGTHNAEVNGHQICISYSMTDVAIDLPNGTKKLVSYHRSVTRVTWDGRVLRMEARK